MLTQYHTYFIFKLTNCFCYVNQSINQVKRRPKGSQQFHLPSLLTIDAANKPKRLQRKASVTDKCNIL